MFIRSCATWLGVVLLGLQLSCTPQTGTRATLTQADLAHISRVAVRVTGNRPFTVTLQRDRMTNTGTIAGGAVGGLMERGIRQSHDQKIERSLKPRLGDYDLLADLHGAVCRHGQEAGLFQAVAEQGAEDGRDSIDAVLHIDVRRWGFRVDFGGDERHIRPIIEFHAKFLVSGRGGVRWERQEMYVGEEAYAVEDLAEKDGLLRSALSKGVNDLSGRIVNDIMFP